MSHMEVPLACGRIALVSECDFETVSQYRWHAACDEYTAYAARWVGSRKSIMLMHRLILQPEVGQMVDHINHNGLDNRRENIRICTHTENQRNARGWKNSSSQFKGVHHNPSNKGRPWRAALRMGGRQVWSRNYPDEVMAARAYDVQAAERFGEFAYLNFPDSLDESRAVYQAAESELAERKRTFGVTWDRACQRWRVTLVVNGRSKYGGLYPTVDEAVAARELLLQSQEVA